MARLIPLAALCTGGVACAAGAEPTPSAECVAAWNAPESTGFIDLLVQATGADRDIWLDYGVGDGAYLLHAGPSDSGGACLGLWQDGRALGFAHTDEEPSLLTPLYGYYFAADWYGSPAVPMLERAVQPPSIRTWIESTGVRSAMILPVTVPDFPIELTPLFKVQLGMHEAFHVDVQMPRWFAETGNWPEWDRQPDRAGLQACYTANENVVAAFEAEREHLATLVERLLDADTSGACEACRSFLAQRNERYEMLADIQVLREDGSAATCREAEAIMELEEGIADYASWTVLYDLGIASRESLMRRYRAIQDDAFYLTGAMQLHAVQMMQPDSMSDVIRRIAGSVGPDDGSPTAVLERALESFCPLQQQSGGVAVTGSTGAIARRP